jgi:aerobic carbon-monoxide dehydrogenase small subunit
MQVSIDVNGERLDSQVEPRTHLADFLREECNLTGTHLGCEHGVCGACTVLVDDVPVRSCITFAARCDGAKVRTVEGFPDDALMSRLREAFTKDHALQCGFCTPGMLIAAYDIVRRLPGASEAEIRHELAGNLCRCTGYVGIVRAIKRVMAETTAPARAARPAGIQPAAGPLPLFTPVTSASSRTAVAAPAMVAELEPPAAGWTRVSESFTIERAPAELWPLLGDVQRMAACMPGATLESFDGRNLRGHLNVRMGPIRTAFAGAATIERDDAQMTGRMTGGGDDKGSSRADGTVVYRLSPQQGGRATLVVVVMDFRLQGALAQFGRSGIVRELIGRTVAEFARNLARLGRGEATARSRELDAGQLVTSSLWSLLKTWLASVFGRGR